MQYVKEIKEGYEAREVRIKDQGVKEEGKGGRIPNCDIWIFHVNLLYLITRYFSSLFGRMRYLSYGLYVQLEIFFIIIYLLLVWNKYNLKSKRARKEIIMGDLKTPYGLLGGNGGLSDIIVDDENLDYLITHSDDPHYVSLVQILRGEARMINPQQAEAEEMIFLSWLNLETTIQSFALDHLFLPVELVLSFIRKIVSHRIKILENSQIVQTITTTFNQIGKKSNSDLFQLTPAAERKRKSRSKLILEGKYKEKKYNRIKMATIRKDHPDKVAMEKIENTKRMKDSRSNSPSNYEQEKIKNTNNRMKDTRSKSPSNANRI